MSIEQIFSQEELIRYSRQFALTGVGLEGQKKLKNAKVLCVGAGGLGSPALLYLTAAGIGTLGIIDSDEVDLSNLHRQILFTKQDVGTNKVDAAKQQLKALNLNTNILTYDTMLTPKNALEIIAQYDVVIDGTDNFKAKYLINDACCILEKPNIYASISQFEGQCAVFTFNGPCYRCLYPQPPKNHIPNCAENGVIGSLPGMLGTIQTTEVIKLILNIGTPLVGRVLQIDALSMSFKTYQLQRNAHCKTCGDQRTQTIPPEELTIEETTDIPSISLMALKNLQRLNQPFELVDVREPHEHEIYHIGGKLIPLHQLHHRLKELDRSLPIITYCKSGKRSIKAAKTLRNEGFCRVSYLEGGIESTEQYVLSVNQCSTKNFGAFMLIDPLY